jgi:hypothetical protein
MPSPSREDDARFTDSLRELSELHAETGRFRAQEDAADACFAEALRLGDEVRRAVRRSEGERPSAADLEQLAELVGRLRRLNDEATRAPAVRALVRAYGAGDAAQVAALACRALVGVELAQGIRGPVFLPIGLRRRAPRGESVLHPQTAAVEIERLFDRGLAPQPDESVARDDSALPEPLRFARRFSDCGSEVAIEVDVARLDAPLLEHEPSGDLWSFTARVDTPRVVAVAAAADDEWWAASPVPYPAYVTGLREALAARAISVVQRDAAEETG